MLVVAQPPVGEYGDQSQGRGQSSLWRGVFVAGTDLFVDERKQCGENQAERERDEEDGFDDKDDVPGIPALGERPEGTDSVVVGEVEENVAEASEAGVGKEQSPARGKVGVARLAAA